jgi:hypothetical protein
MTRGGIRKGAGRKPSQYGATVTIRVPVACIDAIKRIVREFKAAVGGNKITPPQ